MKDHTVRFLTKFLQFKSRQALAGQWDKFHGLTTIEETLDLYCYVYVALLAKVDEIDLSSVLPPYQVEALAAAG